MKSIEGSHCLNYAEVMEKSKSVEAGLYTFHVSTPSIREATEAIRASMPGREVRLEKGEQFKVF